VHELHLEYGAVVRIAPNELSFVEARAWKDIYGHHAGAAEFPKDPSQIFVEEPEHPHIVGAPREQHAKLRRLLSHGFSDKALREQGDVLHSYVLKFIDGLKAKVSEPLDLVKWYNVS
jgi:cytochrome P450